jgi:hypothetical protein
MNFGKGGMGWYTKERRRAILALVSNYGWEMNFKLEGYNECLITYVMAVSSPHPIAAISQGWARNGAIVSGASQYGIPVILIIMELRKCRPMFWSHYSYLGLDPSTLKINMLTIGLDTKSCKNNAPVLYC